MSRAAVRWAAAWAALVLSMAVACSSAPPHEPVLAPPPVAASAMPALSDPVRPAINESVTVQVGDLQRTSIVHRPGNLTGPAPLVVVLHGAFGTPEQTRAATGWDSLADREGIVVAYPSGVGRTWNAGRCCGAAHTRKVDDVQFLHQLVEVLGARENIDKRRVYAVGMSNGAMMVYAWACARPDDLAGIGPVAGARVADCPVPPTVSVVALHGTADRNVPLGGGVGPASITRVNYPGLTTSIAPFLAGDRCTPAPRRSDRFPVHISTFNCVAGAGVTVAVVDGLGHQWPGARQFDPVHRLVQLKVAPPALDATAFLWSHLRSTATIS